MVATGLFFAFFVARRRLRAPSGRAEHRGRNRPTSTGSALVFLLLRTFSSGCARAHRCRGDLNGVPAFPENRRAANAATTLLLLGRDRGDHAGCIITLARLTHLQFRGGPGADRSIGGPAGYIQKTVTTQFGRDGGSGAGSVLLYVVAAFTALILFPGREPPAFKRLPGAGLESLGPGPLPPAPPVAHPR